MNSILQRLAGWELGWLLIVAPFLFFPTPTRALAMLALPLLWGLRWFVTRHFIPRTPLDGSLLLLLTMVLVSLWATVDPLLSLPKVTGVVLGIALYYALVARSNAMQGVWQSVFLFLFTTCIIAGGSLIGTRWSNKFPWLSSITDRFPLLLQGLPGSMPEGFNPNSVAGALLFALPLLLGLLWHYRDTPLPTRAAWQSIMRLALWLAFLLSAGTLLLSQSRGGYIGMLAGVLALLTLPRRRLAILTGISLVILIAILVMGGSSSANQPVPETTNIDISAVDSLQDRQEVWARALYTIQDFPLTGVGMGAFRRVVLMLYPWIALPPNTDIGHAHNHLLAAAVDLGLPGLIAYLALWMGSAAMAWQSWQLAPSPAERILSLSLIAGMVAHFIWGLADANVLGSKAGILFWLCLASLASLHHVVTHRPLPEPSEELSDG